MSSLTEYHKPLSKQQEQFLHDLIYKEGNFFGRDKLFYILQNQYPQEKISRRSLWSYMDKQPILQVNRRPTMNRGIVRPMAPTKPGWIQLDSVQMPNYAGYEYICHAVDLFTKKDYAKALKTLDVAGVKGAIQDFLDAGMTCSYLQVDNGKEHQGDLPEFCKSKGIVLQYSKEYSPWSNGVVESRNTGIKRSLYMWMRATGDANWPGQLPKVLQNINSTFTFRTKQSADKMEKDPSLHAEVAQRIAGQIAQQYRGKTKKEANLQVGDWVRKRLDDTSGIVKRAKTGYWSDEIYVVASIYTPRKTANITQSFKIKRKETGQMQKGYYSLGQLLHIPKETTDLPARPINPPAINEEVQDPDLQEWEIDSIVGHRVTRTTRGKPSRLEFKIRFTGYKKLYWEPEGNLLPGAKDLLEQYKRLHNL